jgi:CubicO group peptidase (beta-lactamase class C family)
LTLIDIGCAPATPPRSGASAARISRLPASVAARIDEMMLRADEHQQLPGVSVAIGRRDGTILYARGYGFRNLARRESADENTVYNIASITKQFTAAAILLLAQNHRLTIDDPLSKYFPDIPFAKSVSLRDLMNHTSGIPDYFCVAGYQPNMSSAGIVRLAENQPPHFRPGTAYEYSNTNYVLLGLVIEKVSGSPYASFVRRNLLEPARMESSRVGEVPSDGPDDAVGYTVSDDTPAPVRVLGADLGYGAGAIDSTVIDLLRWDAALYGGRVLTDALRHQMLSARSYRPATTVLYGFGLHERRVSGDRELYHRGRNDGYGGINATFPDDDLAITILANNENVAPMLLVDELHALVVPARKNAQAPAENEIASTDPGIDTRAKSWLERLFSGEVDRTQLSPAAAQRYSADALSSLSARMGTYGPLQSLTLMEKDSRCLGWNYSYRAVFKNAVAEYRFGVDRDGRVWNLALDRED